MGQGDGLLSDYDPRFPSGATAATDGPASDADGPASDGSWSASPNWRYCRCPIDTPAARFGPFAELVGLWHARTPDGAAAPPRAEIDVFDLRRWIGRIFIAEIERDPFAVRFALWGTMLTKWWGVDYTGKHLGSEAKDPGLWQTVEGSYFRLMDAEPFVGVACGRLDQYLRPHIKVIGLDLPLVQDGRLTHVLSAHLQIGLDDTPETILPDCPIAEEF